MSSDEDGDSRLDALRHSYGQVLEATKHEDDKIGRFLTAIAFLVAGALLFSQQAWFLQVRYDLGGGWPLPAMALLGFLFAVVFSVLLYILTIASPVTPPPAPTGETRRSRLFFQLIANESPETWTAYWDRPSGAIRNELVSQYRNETLNLAHRAFTKRNRSTEATHLFAASLLFFLLTIALGIHSAIHVLGDEPVVGSVPWDLAAELMVAAGLSLFPIVILYQQWAAHMVRRAGRASDRRASRDGTDSEPQGQATARRKRDAIARMLCALGLGGFLLLGVGLALFIVVLVLVADRAWWPVTAAGVALAGLAVWVGWESARLARDAAGRLIAPKLTAAVLVVVVMAVCFLDFQELRVAMAVGVALTPTTWQLWRSLGVGKKLEDARRGELVHDG